MTKFIARYSAEQINPAASWTEMPQFNFELSFQAGSSKRANAIAETARLGHIARYGGYYDIRLREIKPIKSASSSDNI